ncbi:MULTISPECIES: DUF7146 domain-containing protein [unclassified Sphingobium]|uniref:DUF7146 domain-containing protein n=1 Tax=unclassified Sphingobium TaxID=2611147 RepID=UPI001EF0780B|nr:MULTISPECIES: toprim domain-containing protein [unclassified Sphingobium]
MSADLDHAGEAIVRRLGGRWVNGGGMCRCPAHADKTPSLSVRRGTSTLLFKCFAGCTFGEILQALRSERFQVPRQASGLPYVDPSPCRRELALKLWREAQPLAGTPAQRYLASRHIMTWSPALRYHPATPLGAGRNVRFLPAMLAAITHDRKLLGIQRNFIQLTGQPAPLSKNKRSLGTLGRGAVELAAPMATLGLAEGVENALSAAMLLDIPVWATLGAERFARIIIPPTVTRLVLLADNDPAGERAVARAREAYATDNRDLVTLWPPRSFNDWNQLLLAGGEVERWRARLAA